MGPPLRIPSPSSTTDLNTPSSSAYDDEATMNRRTKQLPIRPQTTEAPSEEYLVKFLHSTVRPIFNYGQPYIDFRTLNQQYNIEVLPFDLETGSLPRGRATYTQPVPIETMQGWIDRTGGRKLDHTDARFVNDPDRSQNTNMGEAEKLYRTISYYLCDNPEGTPHPKIMSDWTSWSSSSHPYQFLKSCKHPDWEAHHIMRHYIKAEGTRPTRDLSTPHHTTFVSNEIPLREDVLLTSEIATILSLANVYIIGAITYKWPHQVIPVTVVSASWRSVRVVQGIVDYSAKPQPSVEIRKSRILNFEHGLKTEQSWREFLSLLCWMVGSAVVPPGMG